MRDAVDIQPVSAGTVTRSMRGKQVFIEDDVQGIAKQLKDIDENLFLFYAIDEDTYVVGQRTDGGESEKFVTAMKGGLDQRILQRVREVAARDYDLVTELEAADKQADRDREHLRREQSGPVAEKLLHALRKDLNIKNRVAI